VKKLKVTCYACDRDSEEGVWIDTGEWTFYCFECCMKNEEQFPNWEHAEKRYLTKDNNTRDNWAECIWCNTISHDSIIEYDDNGEPICPECRRAGAMAKI
jgi:hypothetical protein